MIGHILDNRYKILEKIGTGGMAVVYKAQDILLDRIVAVKILLTKYGNDHDFVIRFRQEAQAAAKLSHPNIVNIYDVGCDDDIYYIIMEYVRGETLKEYIEKHGHLPINTSIQITFDIGDALEAAHKNGIVHCDIKPHNILVTETGRIKVADFGIARAVNAGFSNDSSSAVLGSVHYLSPEQASGVVVDERTDIYSLGVVMYEMMTGMVPFKGDTAISVALQHVQDEITLPTKYNRRIPRLVEQCILKAMAKNPDNRFQTIAEMMSELRLSQGFVNTNKGAMPIIKNNFATQKLPSLKPDKKQQKKNVLSRLIDSISSYSKRSIILSMAVVFIAAFLWAFFSFGNFWSTRDITVPDVTGKQIEIARELLSDEKLNLSINEVESDTVPVGEVIAQTPSGGSVVKENRTIYLTISKGNRGTEVLIPDLRNLVLDDAKSKLEEIGLTIGEVHYAESDTVENGKIISQSPSSPRKAAKGTSVDLIICRKSQKKEVPTVTNMSLDAAVKTLESAGFSVGNVTNLDASKNNSQAKVVKQAVRDNHIVDMVVEYPVAGTAIQDNGAARHETDGTPHYGTVNISVPAGASSQHVRIIVTDDTGTHVVYDKNQFGGDKITKNVSGIGKTRVRVYINDSLVQEQDI